MKSRSPLLILLVVSAYAAVAAAGATFPLSIWLPINLYFWLAIVAWLAVEAATLPRPLGVFASGALVICLGYVATSAFQDEISHLLLPEMTRFTMPHSYLVGLLVPETGPWSFSNTTTMAANVRAVEETQALTLWAIMNTSLACGYLGGRLALSRHHRWQQRILPAGPR